MLLDDRGEPAGKAFIRLGLLLQHIAGKDHVILVLFHHLGHARVGRGTDARHGRLRLLVGLDADLVDAVRHILLLRGFQRFAQGIVQHHPLLGVRLQFVD